MSFINEQQASPSLEDLYARLHALEQQIQQINNNKSKPQQSEQYLDIAAACAYMGLGRTNLYKIMNKGLIAYTYIGRQRRVLLSDVKKYIQSTYVAAKPSIL
jgi:excisionase family DNA binding protein